MKKIMLIILICMTVLTAGCFPSGEVKQNNDSEMQTDKRITFDIDCPQDYPQQAQLLFGEPMLFESIDMESLFFGENKGGYWKQLNEHSSVLPSGKYYHLYAKGENDTTLCYDAGMVIYTSKNASDGLMRLLSSYRDLKGSQEYFRQLIPNDTIDGFEQQSAVNQADELLKKLGIPAAKPEIYAVDKTASDNLKKEGSNNYTDEWSDKQQAYMLVYPIEYCGLPTLCSQTNGNVSESGRITLCAKAVIGISKNGFEYVECQNILAAKVQKTQDIISPQKAKETIEKYYSSIALGENVIDVRVSGCELRYLPQCIEGDMTKAELVPVWTFCEKKHHKATDGTEMTRYSLICVNAFTGEIM